MLDVIINNNLLEIQKDSAPSNLSYLKKLSETVEELNKQYSQTQGTCSPAEEDTDNSKSTEDTDTPK